MNERIKQVRKSLKLSQDEFGKKLGVTRGAITNIELNKTDPKPLFVDLICEIFDVNKNWLETGNGNMFIEKDRSQVIADFMVDILKDEETSFRKRLIEALAALDISDWEDLERIANKTLKKD